MSNTAQILALRLREPLLDGKFIAYTNFKDQIDDVSFEEATFKISSLNTIALLVYHIHYYLDGVLHVFNGGSLDIKDKYSYDMPAVSSENDWHDIKEKFYAASLAYIHAVENMTDEQLDAVFVKVDYGTYQRNIDAMIEHAYYHLGQVVIIKKMIRAS